MAYYLRESGRHIDRHGLANHVASGGTLLGQGYHGRDGFRFIRAAPLVMHDRCADTLGIGGHPWDPGRKSFGEQGGGALCWAPCWTDDPEQAPCCFSCGNPVLGAG